MKGKGKNRRKYKRLRIEKSVKIPVHLFPLVPFIGEPVMAESVNLSAGGMALKIAAAPDTKKIKKGTALRVHFRLPGRFLQEFRGAVAHKVEIGRTHLLVGIRFTKIPKNVFEQLKEMAADNDACDRRIREQDQPWCDPNCAFHSLCRKPIRTPHEGLSSIDEIEIALQ